MPDLDLENLNQGQVASLFGVDRATINQWQKIGLPYIAGTQGKPSRYITPLVVRWHMAREVARDKRWRVALDGTLETVCFGYALDHDEDGSARKLSRVRRDLERCGIKASEADFHRTLGYMLAVVHQRRHGHLRRDF